MEVAAQHLRLVRRVGVDGRRGSGRRVRAQQVHHEQLRAGRQPRLQHRPEIGRIVQVMQQAVRQPDVVAAEPDGPAGARRRSAAGGYAHFVKADAAPGAGRRPGFGRRRLPRVLDHRRRAVDAVEAPPRTGRSKPAHDVARPAAQIDARRPPRRRPVEHPGAEQCIGLPEVGLRVGAHLLRAGHQLGLRNALHRPLPQSRNGWTNRPLRSFGSIHVLFGGMTAPASATASI